MSLPSRDAAAGWVDLVVDDAAGVEVGRCLRVYADLDTGEPEWLVVERAGRECVLPLVDAREFGGRISVSFPADLISAAPEPTGREGLSTEEEVVFYAHYGVETGSFRSESLLPAEESGSEGSAGPEVAIPEPEAAGTAEPAAAGPAPYESPSAPTGEESYAAESAVDLRSATRGGVRRGLAVAGLGTGGALAYALRRRTGRPSATDARRILRAAAASGTRAVGAAKAAGAKRASALPKASRRRRLGAPGTVRARKLAAAARSTSGAARQAKRVARRPSPPSVRRSSAVQSVATMVARRKNHIQRKGSRLMGKLTTGLALGAGYVLGARAGRERYEKIKKVTTQVAQRPEVQQASEKVRSAVNDKLATSGPARKLGYPEHERWRALRPTGRTEPADFGTSDFTTAMPTTDPLGAPPVEPGDPLDSTFEADPTAPPVIDVTTEEMPRRDPF